MKVRDELEKASSIDSSIRVIKMNMVSIQNLKKEGGEVERELEIMKGKSTQSRMQS